MIFQLHILFFYHLFLLKAAEPFEIIFNTYKHRFAVFMKKSLKEKPISFT